MKKQNSNSFNLEFGNENQFMLTPGRSGDSQDQLIRGLELKNKKLKFEIDRIDEVLNANSEKVQYGIKIPQSSSESASIELKNAYKKIKTYEYEINKLKQLQQNGHSYVDQLKKSETVLKQKEDLSQKLKKQLHNIKKASHDITKQLKNNSTKESYQNKIQKLRTENKVLRQKLKEIEQKKKNNERNFESQGIFIFKLQKQLSNQGFTEEEVLSIKYKYSDDSKKDTNYMSAYTKNRKSSADEDDEKNFVEDRTPQHFKEIQNQIQLLQKMDKDYQNQLKNLEEENQKVGNVNLKSRNKLLEIQDQIQRIQVRIGELKGQIDPRNMKPSGSYSMHLKGVGRYGKVNQSLAQIKQQVKSSPFKSLFKTTQIGNLSKLGRRFSDRIKLGKQKSKLIGVDIYENKHGKKNVIGIQSVYQIKGKKSKSPLNMTHDPKLADKKNFTLESEKDFINSIQCLIDEEGIIVGLGFRSAEGVSFRAGIQGSSRRPLNIEGNQYIASLFGSFTTEGLELLGCEVIED